MYVCMYVCLCDVWLVSPLAVIFNLIYAWQDTLGPVHTENQNHVPGSQPILAIVCVLCVCVCVLCVVCVNVLCV